MEEAGVAGQSQWLLRRYVARGLLEYRILDGGFRTTIHYQSRETLGVGRRGIEREG
jgi:hypothetical protein